MVTAPLNVGVSHHSRSGEALSSLGKPQLPVFAACATVADPRVHQVEGREAGGGETGPAASQNATDFHCACLTLSSFANRNTSHRAVCLQLISRALMFCLGFKLFCED